VNFAYQGGFVLVPLMLAEVYGYTSTRISLVTMARPLFYGLAGPFAGSMAVRFGERRAAVSGAVLVVASCVMLATVHASRVDLMIFISLALAGAGLGSMVPAMTATVTMAVEDHDLGIAGATSQMVLQVGTVLGMQVQQTIQVSREQFGLQSSYDAAFLVGAAVALVGVFVCSLVRSTPRTVPVRARGASTTACPAPAVAVVPGEAGCAGRRARRRGATPSRHPSIMATASISMRKSGAARPEMTTNVLAGNWPSGNAAARASAMTGR
jgi:MFS family permease